MCLTWNLQEHLECTQSVIGGYVAGTFNQSLQCTQDVFVGFQAPSPPVPGPGPDSKLKIPEFLIGKHNIYCYLNCIEESGFQDLLKNYISFKAANCSRICGALSTYCRPDVIRWWSGRARPDRLPPYDSLKSLTESIVEWWIYLQPEWRKITLSKISRVGGDWRCLYQLGMNGLLNVVVLAYWWIKILEQRESTVDEAYTWFVSDVTWVFSQLTDVAHEGIF